MRRYAVKRTNKNKDVAILNYEDKRKTYTIDIPEDVTEMPGRILFGNYVKVKPTKEQNDILML